LESTNEGEPAGYRERGKARRKGRGGDETVALGPFGVSEETDAGDGDRAKEKGCNATDGAGRCSSFNGEVD
jgi:hypothetical protein